MARLDLPLRIPLSLMAMIGFGFGSSLSLPGCGSSPQDVLGSLPEDGNRRVSEAYTLADVSSGLIGGIDFGGGEHVFVFGEKAANETVTRLQAIAIIDQARNLYEVSFDEQGLPERMSMNGQTFTVSYIAPGSNGIWQATISDGSNRATIALPAEFNVLYEAAQAEVSSGSPSARPFYGRLMLGVVKIGLGLSGFVALGGAAAAGAAVGTPAALAWATVSSISAIAGMVSGTASGAKDIGASFMDRPETPHEQGVGTALSVLGYAAAVPSLVTASDAFILNTGIDAADKLTILGVAVDAIGANGELAGPTQSTYNQACSGTQGCTVSTSVGNSGGTSDVSGGGTSGGTTTSNKTTPDLNGCWHLIMVKDGGNILNDGRLQAWSVEENQLTGVWRYSTTGRIKQEFRPGPDIVSDGALLSDMHGSVTDQGSGRFVISYFYGIFARLSDGTLVRVGDRATTLTGSQENVWNSGGYTEWTGSISGRFDVVDSSYGSGNNSTVVSGDFTGEQGTCLGSTFNPAIQITGPEALYQYRTSTLTASMPAVQEPIAWTWSYVGSDSLPAENERLSVSPQSIGTLALWVTADVSGLEYHRLYEVPVIEVPVKVSISGPTVVRFSAVGLTVAYNGVLERGDSSHLRAVWSQVPLTTGQDAFELLNVDGWGLSARCAYTRSNTVYLELHVWDEVDENIWDTAYLPVDVIYEPPPPPSE